MKNIIRFYYFLVHSQWAMVSLWNPNTFQKYFTSAINSYIKKGSTFYEAAGKGLFFITDIENPNVNLSSIPIQDITYSDIIQFDVNVNKLKDLKKYNGIIDILRYSSWMIKTEKPLFLSWYGPADEIFLLSCYILAKEKGLNSVQAVYYAQKWLPFRKAWMASPLVKGIRKSQFGQFVNLTFHSIPRFVEVLITRPWVIIGTLFTTVLFMLLLPFLLILPKSILQSD